MRGSKPTGKGIIIAAVVLTVAETASGYMVAPAKPLKEIEKASELIVKATAISEQWVKDDGFAALPGFAPCETTMKVVSVLKGPPLTQFRFRHYAPKDTGDPVMVYEPQNYVIRAGSTYVVFANKEQGETYQSIWSRSTLKEDQGLLRTADNKPHTGKTVTEAIWNELVRLSSSASAADAAYGIDQLDAMTGGKTFQLHDFDRAAALELIARRIDSWNAEIASAAIAVVGSESPYMVDEFAEFWLAGMGKGVLSGVGQSKPTGNKAGSDKYRTTLLAVANSQRPTKVRALAIRALGRGMPGPPIPDVSKWFADPDPHVRRAAVVLLADSDGQGSSALIAKAAKDSAWLVRHGAARAVGFGQMKHLLPELGRLLRDPESKVQEAAALSLLSFNVGDTSEVLRANLDSQFRSIFVNALARNYIDQNREYRFLAAKDATDSATESRAARTRASSAETAAARASTRAESSRSADLSLPPVSRLKRAC